jgi:glycosyltransferase involved in cell wall biosynthesis
VATYTDELIRMLRAVAPEVVPSLWAIARGEAATLADEAPPVAGGLPAAGVIAFDDPSAYRRAGLRLSRVGSSAALLQFGPGTAGGPHGRYLLGLADELKRQHLPYLVTLHGVRPTTRPDDADVAAALCRNAAGVIVLSQSARSALVHNRIAASGRIAVVPQGAPPELVRTGRPPDESAQVGPAITDALARISGGPVLTTIGHLRPAKGIEVAVTALPLIAERHPGVRYVVAGRTLDDQLRLSGEWYRETLARIAETLGVAERLILVDADPTPADLAALLRATDVYLAPDVDRGRTSGGSLGYALAAGRPVVAAANPFANEVVPARGGLVVAPGDPTALAAAADTLITDPVTGAGRWPSSIATAEQIAGLVGLITGSSSRIVARTNRLPGTLVPGTGAEGPYPRRAVRERVYLTPAGRDHGDSDTSGGIPRKIRHRQDDPPWTPASGCRERAERANRSAPDVRPARSAGLTSEAATRGTSRSRQSTSDSSDWTVAS